VQVWSYNSFRPKLKPNKDINDNVKNQKLGYDFLPEPKPNNEPLLIGLPSATLSQNAMLCARAYSRQSSFQSFSRFIKFSILQK
jgi:hypothetical protein